MKDSVLIDTSVWIAYFRRGASDGIGEAVDSLLTRGDILVPKLVLAELIQGARSEKEIAVIQEFVEAFHVVGEGEDTGIETGKLAFVLRKKGKSVGLADCYIAVIARENGCSILTLDKHFEEMREEAGLALIPL